MRKHLALSSSVAAMAYFLFYLFFTGAAQYIEAPRIGIASTTVVVTFVETQLYTGPLIQVVGDGFVFNLRIYPAVLGVFISLLLGYNAGILYTLYRHGLLRTCLMGTAWSGLGGIFASAISFGYLCCGWPVSLAIFGVSSIIALSPYLTAAAITLLAVNAYVLTKRWKLVVKQQQHNPTL
ncbi:MAG: hypothetical protein QXE96_07470 [Candidatus Caldarchaeum sp.]